MKKGKILLLEDDANLHETIAEFLEEENYDVVSVFDGQEAEEKLYETSFDILLLDVNTPFIDGFELLKIVRSKGVLTPAIYITSMRSVDDLERGFDSGCDDYIRKPFALKELLIRIETLLKRSFYHEEKSYIVLSQTMKYEIDTNTLFVNDNSVHLGNKESKLLKIFIQNSDEVLSHERIYAQLWDYDEVPSDTALRTYIKNLRKIIGKEHIVSIKKQGYKFIIRK
jgi:DNA-binding response OmpR family regulator